jgi:hypothetical protein
VVNAAQQLGVSLGLSLLVTIAAGASAGAGAAPGLHLDAAARAELAHAVSAALTGSAVLIALGLVVIAATVGRLRRGPATPALEVAR